MSPETLYPDVTRNRDIAANLSRVTLDDCSPSAHIRFEYGAEDQVARREGPELSSLLPFNA